MMIRQTDKKATLTDRQKGSETEEEGRAGEEEERGSYRKTLVPAESSP